MSQPEQFILDSDFATLKNDNQGTAQVTIPSSTSVAGSGSASFSTDLVIGASGAISRVRMSSTKDSNKWRISNAIDYTRIGVNSGSPANYDIFLFVWRPSATVLRCQALIQNPYATTLTGASGAETVTFYVNTFLPPFA